MTDIMIDMTSRPYKKYRINRCHYCDRDKYSDGKPIDPTIDQNAKKTDKGEWMCGVCIAQGNTLPSSEF
jgi:hypothetical protein